MVVHRAYPVGVRHHIALGDAMAPPAWVLAQQEGFGGLQIKIHERLLDKQMKRQTEQHILIVIMVHVFVLHHSYFPFFC